jgi:hypothetical protein
MDVASVKLKANLLRTWSLSTGTREDFKEIRALYGDILLQKEIGVKDNISLIFSDCNMPSILRLYNRIGNRLKQFIKRLSGKK